MAGNNFKQKTLTTASNLANVLPTGTVLMFQALLPSFTNNGECLLAQKYLTLGLIFFCSVACFVSSFTDSFVHDDDKLYYGIAIRNGFYVFNDDRLDGLHPDNIDTKKMLEEYQEMLEEYLKYLKMLEEYKLTPIDFVHAIGSLIVFLVVSISSSEVQNCFFPNAGPNEKALITNLPLGAGLLASVLFIIFPTRRRGIGYGDMAGTRTTAVAYSSYMIVETTKRFYDRLPTKNNLTRRAIIIDTVEELSAKTVQKRRKISSTCLNIPKSWKVWASCYSWWSVSTATSMDVPAHFKQHAGLIGGKNFRQAWEVILFAAVWSIWLPRNQVIFGYKQDNVEEVLGLINYRSFYRAKLKPKLSLELWKSDSRLALRKGNFFN